jgi:outer membrane lipoprotein-sorting protein
MKTLQQEAVTGSKQRESSNRPVGRQVSAVAVAGLLLALICLAAAPSSASAAEPAATPTATPTTSAAEVQVAPEVLAVLDKMDAAGKAIKTVRSKFDYELNQTLYSDITKRKGEILYQAPNLLRFEFSDKPQETYVFDGRTLFHKKDPTKQLITYEIRLPDEPAVDSLEIGKTPFPLPFGQRKENVLKHFTVSLDKAEQEKDKEKRTVLVLIPKKNTAMSKDYTRILLWLDPKMSIPTRAKLYDTSENETTIDFRNLETDKSIDAKLFTRPEVPQDWEIVPNKKESGAPRPATATPPTK